MKRIIRAAIILPLCLLSAELLAEVTMTVDVPPAAWDLNGSPVPETHWSPWLMPGVQAGVRAALGVRISKGAVSVRAPIRLTVSYDPEEAKAGREIHLKVKAEPIALSAPNLSFETSFGLFLPNRLQVGLINIPVLGSPLPWVDVPYDLWGLLGKVPKAGEYLAALKDQIGINTSGSGPIQLGTWSEFHDKRSLISFDLSSEFDMGEEDIANGILDSLPSGWMDKALTIIKIFKRCSETEAAEYLQGMIADNLSDVLADLFNLGLSADPYYKIKGTKLGVTVTVAGPSGTGSGQYWLEFTEPGQTKEIVFSQITPFVTDGDVLRVWASDVIYDMEIRQGLDAIVDISTVSLPLENTEKTIAYAQAIGHFTREQGSIAIPLAKSDEPFMLAFAMGRGQSGMCSWASPSTPMVGSLSVYRDGLLIATASETRLRTDHKLLVDGLSQGQTYDFILSGIGADGKQYVNPSIRVNCLAPISNYYRDQTSRQYGSLAGLGDDPSYTATVSDVAVATQSRSATFSWNTNVPMTSYVYLTNTSDGSASFVWKKTQLGSFPTNARSDFPKFETSHSVEVADLEPMTTYRYMIVSEWFKDNDPSTSMYFPLSKTGTFTTGTENASLVRVKVLYNNLPVTNFPVTIANQATGFRTVLKTGSGNGTTRNQFCPLPGTWKISTPALFFYKASSRTEPSLPVSASASQVNEIVINLEAIPERRGLVLDGSGNPVIGASILVNGSVVATTDASGSFLPADVFQAEGVYPYIARKPGYLDGAGTITVTFGDKVRRRIVTDALCRDLSFNLSVTARDQTGNPIKGATISLSEGSTVLGSMVTDASGRAIFPPRSVGTDPAVAKTLTVTGKAPTGSTYVDGIAVFEARPTETQTLILTMPMDTTAPTVSDAFIRQTGLDSFTVTASAGEPGCSARLVVTDGSGVKREGAWTFITSQDIVLNHRLAESVKDKPASVDLEVKDKPGNLTRVPGLSYASFSGPHWGFSLVSTTETTAVLRFNPFPSAEGFSHYILRTNDTQSVRVDSRTPGTVTLTGLPTNRTFGFQVTAFAKDGSTLAISPTISGSTLSARPTIGKIAIPRAIGVGYPVTIEIPATDPDSPLRGMSLEGKGPSGSLEKTTIVFPGTSRSERGLFTLSFPVAGTYILKFSIRDERSETEGDLKVIVSNFSRPSFSLSEVPPIALGSPARLEGLVMRPRKEAEAPVLFSVDWGDRSRPEVLKLERAKDDRAIVTKLGLAFLDEEAMKAMNEIVEKEQRDKLRYPVAAEHLYAADGEYTVTVKALLSTETGFIESEPRRFSLRVDPVLPKLQVSDKLGCLAIGSNGKAFGLRVAKGSYDLGELKVDWGDGTKELIPQPTRGALLSHYYAAKGSFPIEISLSDARGNAARFSMTAFSSQAEEPKEDKAIFDANPLDPAYYQAVRSHAFQQILVAPKAEPVATPAATPMPLVPGKSPKPKR